MASNAELTRTAEELAQKLGRDITTAGLTNAQLTALVTGLTSDVDAKEASATTAVTGLTSESDAAATQAPTPKRPPYSVAAGRSITSLRGVIGPGEEVRAEDIPGQANLDRLVAIGVVVKS